MTKIFIKLNCHHHPARWKCPYEPFICQRADCLEIIYVIATWTPKVHGDKYWLNLSSYRHCKHMIDNTEDRKLCLVKPSKTASESVRGFCLFKLHIRTLFFILITDMPYRLVSIHTCNTKDFICLWNFKFYT